MASFIGETRAQFNKNEERLDKIETHLAQLTNSVGAQMKSLEIQIGQLATAMSSQQQKGQFLSNTKLNPKG